MRPLLRIATLLAICCVLPTASARAHTFTFEGRGWGHGIGMSQYGAKGMADAGFGAAAILKHFYRGTAVEPVPTPAELRVGLVQRQTEILLTADGPFDISGAGGTARGNAGETWRIVPDPTGQLVVHGGSGLVAFSSPPPVTVDYGPHGSLLKLPQTGHRYKRGRIDLDAYLKDEGWRVRSVLIVPFEQYLYGLGEVPSSWPVEALRAQAIAGRTYALEKAVRLGQNRDECNCAVYATTIDQAYIGYEKEAATAGSRWTGAVDATAGVAVTAGGRAIQALYSSSDGGHSESNEHVWGTSPVSYLRGVCDPWDAAGGDNPNSRWTATYDEPTMRAKLESGGVSVGTIERIELPQPRGTSGRVAPVVSSGDGGGVRVVGSSGVARLSGDRFRSLLGMKSTLFFRRGAGYWMVASDGGMFTFGEAPFLGSMGGKPVDKPIVGMAASPLGGQGYWLLATDGGIFSFGNVCFYGSMGGKPLDKPMVGIAPTSSAGGYWTVASDGGIFTFGDAGFLGSMGGKPLDKPIVGMAPTSSGRGYWMVATDGGIFTFGDAGFLGSMGGKPLDKPIVGMAPTPSGRGYWMVASDGGIFSFGDAGFYGSMGGRPLDKPIVGMSSTATGRGYWMVASDGGIFSFGDAGFYGSMGGKPLAQPVNGIAVS